MRIRQKTHSFKFIRPETHCGLILFSDLISRNFSVCNYVEREFLWSAAASCRFVELVHIGQSGSKLPHSKEAAV
jgi:hypothetical protein